MGAKKKLASLQADVHSSVASSSKFSASDQAHTHQVIDISHDAQIARSEHMFPESTSFENSIPEVIWLIDERAAHSRLTAADQENFLRVFGWPSEVLKNGRWGFVSIIHPNDQARVLYELSLVRPNGSQVDFRVIDSRGEERQLRLRWRFIQDASWVEYQAWDRTDEALLQDGRNQDRLQQRIDRSIRSRLMKGEFVGRVVAWPLRVDDPTESVECSEVLSWMQEVWWPRADMQGIEARLQVNAKDLEGLTLMGPKYLILTAVAELLQNAAEALQAPRGRQQPWISIDMTALEDTLIIGIEDSGAGVAVRDRGNLFLPFFTKKSPSQHLGLGLYMVRQIAEALHGTVRFDHFSARSRFAIQLPLLRR